MTTEDRPIKKAAVISVLFVICVIAVLIKLSVKTVEVNDTIENEDNTEEAQEPENNMNYYDEEAAGEGSGVTSYLKVPLPESVTEDDIVIEDIYIDQTVRISINNIDKDFFKNNPLVGSSDHIGNVVYGSDEGVAQIELLLDSVYEHEAEYVDNSLNMRFIEPKSVYDKVVVIDAGHGSRAGGTVHFDTVEKEINLEIVLKLKELLDNSDIKAYYTRTEDTNPSFEARSNLANNVNADFFISVHNNGDVSASSSSGTEVLYDELAEESDFGSKQLAQICQEEVVAMLGSRDRGLVNGNSIFIIRTSKVPVALVEVGFITNKTEAANLRTDEYQQKAAQGIYNAILRAYEERDNAVSTNSSDSAQLAEDMESEDE